MTEEQVRAVFGGLGIVSIKRVDLILHGWKLEISATPKKVMTAAIAAGAEKHVVGWSSGYNQGVTRFDFEDTPNDEPRVPKAWLPGRKPQDDYSDRLVELKRKLTEAGYSCAFVAGNGVLVKGLTLLLRFEEGDTGEVVAITPTEISTFSRKYASSDPLTDEQCLLIAERAAKFFELP